MKTERRHELQTNWLADRVGEFILVVKPYAKGVAGILLACLVVWLAMLYKAHRSEAEEAEGWNKLWSGLMVSGLKADEVLVPLSETNSTHPTGEWALLILADDNLTTGVGALFTEKAVGRNQIKTALDNYKSVLTTSTDPLLREHALYGVGRAQESLCKVEDAETAYKQLRSEYPNGSYFIRAKERLDDLARKSTATRYDWFASLEPPTNNGFGKGLDKTGDKGGLELPSDLEPFSQFTAPGPKTPPAEPRPDTGAPAPKDSKTGDEKSSDAKTPEKSKPADKAGETSPVAPKPTDTKAPDTKATDTTPTATTPTTGPTVPPATPAVPAPTAPTPTPTPTTPTPTVPTPDDSKTTPPKPTDSK